MVFSRFLSPRLILIHALRDQLDLYVSLESVQLKLKKTRLFASTKHTNKRGARKSSTRRVKRGRGSIHKPKNHFNGESSS